MAHPVWTATCNYKRRRRGLVSIFLRRRKDHGSRPAINSRFTTRCTGTHWMMSSNSAFPAIDASWYTKTGSPERLRASSLPGGGVAFALGPSESSTKAARRVSWLVAGPQLEAEALAPLEQMRMKWEAVLSAGSVADCRPLARVSGFATPPTAAPAPKTA